MKEINQLNLQGYNSLTTDYKTEVIAYNLWKKYPTIAGVFLKRLGSNNRSFHKDLKRIKVESLDVQEIVISVESYREGLYDYLPEGLFHPPSLKGSRHAIASVVEQIRQEKRAEEQVRSFFQPFELEIYFCHVKALDVADGFEELYRPNQLRFVMEELWPLLQHLDPANAKVFACMLPHFHSARGKKIWIEECLSACLQVPVHIAFTAHVIVDLVSTTAALVLGEMHMGLTSMLVNPHEDGNQNWSIEFGPIAYENLHLYLEGSPLRLLLQGLYDYCLPLTAQVVEVFVTQCKETSFCINTGNNSLLGYSTYL